MDYQAPYKDMQFLLELAHQTQGLDQIEGLADYDLDLANAVVDEANKFASGVLAPLNAVGDTQGCRFDEGQVITPEGWKDAYHQFKESGWIGLALPEAFGGQGLPKYIAQPVNEMWLSANLAFVMFHALAQGGSEILLEFANDNMKQRYLPSVVSGDWTIAMALTEPNAGSDLGALTTKAMPQDDGTYLIKGQKIFITYGEHDLADNIVHLVLARTPDAPEGSRGISLFAVPKYRVDENGVAGEFNDIRCTGIEHKLGLHGSPTCSISYGDQDACYGELIGELNQGLKAMFILMNEARLSCGMQGVALGERAFQAAAQYSQERIQGSDRTGKRMAIVEHPDVQRMLLDIRSETFALRALGYQIAAMLDSSEQLLAGGQSVDGEPGCANERDNIAQVQILNQRVALLTPVFKGFSTEQANILTGTSVQIFGGMGFVEETGVAQFMRDARITTIYEGTTGIQAKDLLHRKIRGDKGAALALLMEEISAVADSFLASERLGETAQLVLEAVLHFQDISRTVLLSDEISVQELDYISVPVLKALGLLCCGWQLLEAAQAAEKRLAEDEEYFGNVIALAQFYGCYHLPKVSSLLAVATRRNKGVAAYTFQ